MTDRALNVWGMIGRGLFVLSIFVAFGCVFLIGRHMAARELGGAAHASTEVQQVSREAPRSPIPGWTPQQVQDFGESVLGIAYACQGRKMPEDACQKYLAYVLASKLEPDHLDD